MTIGSDSAPIPITPKGLEDCRQCSTARSRLTSTTSLEAATGAGLRDV